MNPMGEKENEHIESLMCSRCMSIQTSVTPLAWTLSTLRQTTQDSPKFAKFARSESTNDAMNTSELLRQYRTLQVNSKSINSYHRFEIQQINLK